MNTLKTLAVLLWVALLCPVANGQLNCSFDADQDSLEAQDSLYRWQYHKHANYVNWFRNHYNITQTYTQYGAGASAQNCNKAVFIVPVVFHVMYDPNQPATNISDSIIEAQLQVLNAAYANARGSTHPQAVNTDIQFCLAHKKPDGTTFNGINRISYTGSHIKPTGAQKAGVAASIYYDRERYVNIWVVPDIKDQSNNSMNTGGYSNINYTTGIDGIVMRYDFMGDYNGCNSCFHPASSGTALAHEMGHFLGLYHTFRDSCLGGTDSSDCYKKGDLCCDTRPCNQTFNCPTGTTQPDCPNLPYYAGQDDNRKNYMSYADEVCKNNFTQNQKEIMHAVLMGTRRGLIETKNTNALALNCCHQSAWFNAANTFMCAADTVKFEAVAQAGATYRWIIKLGSTTIEDTTLSTHTYQRYFSTQGKYDVTLTVDDSLGLLSFTRQNFVEYANCGNNLATSQGHWYFGKYAGLRFTTVGAVKDLGAYFGNISPTVNTGEGVITRSDNNGNLLFYGGGDSTNLPYFRIYNSSHTEVNTAKPIRGLQSSTQGGIVIPLDNDTNKYFLVVTGGNPIGQGVEFYTSGARYTLIDKTNGNLVVQPDTNIVISPPPGSDSTTDNTIISAECITAIPRCGGGHWLILLDEGSSEKRMVVYKVDSSGITYHSSSDSILRNSYYGQMKASPNGNFIACPGYIFRFNNSTGMATYYKEYGVIEDFPYNDYYGLSFSPNSEVLYVVNADSNFTTKILQYDLLSSNNSLSKQVINLPQTFFYFNSLQLAPDNKIYLSNFGVPQLGVINFPNNLNNPNNPNNCGFTINGPTLQNSNGEGGECTSGLPNMIDAKAPASFPLGFAHIDSNCRTVKFYPDKYCDSVQKWYFGDGDSTTDQAPEHTYAIADNFTVKMVMMNGDSVVKTIQIGLDTPAITGTTFISCDTTQVYSYTISNRRDNLIYNWSVINGVLSGIDTINATAEVFWSGTDNKIIVRADDPRTGCSIYDTLTITRGATPESDTLWADVLPCTKGNSYTLRGHNHAGMTYAWYQSPDSTNWTLLTGQTADTLADTLTNDSIYYKRERSNYGCSSFSIVKKITPQLYITRQPQDYVACLGGEREFTIGIGTAQGVTANAQWNYQFKGASGWSAQFYTGDTLYDFPTTIAYDSAKFRCTVTAACGTILSDTAYVVIEKTPAITSHPQTQTKAEGDSVLFIVTDTALQPYYTWYKNRNGAQSWDSIPGEHNDTLIIRNLNYCDNKKKYRVTINKCGETSTPATLTITTAADLWAKDGVNDIGTEPNTATANDYWESPDLWNCWPDSTCTTHKNPEYVTIAWNYLRAMVRNKGTAASADFDLKTYWTLGGFYEQWPLSWHYDLTNNGFYNSTTNTIYPMGAEIGTVSHSGLGAGAQLPFTFQWAPPHPSWYNTSPVFGTGKVSHPICLLSRIVPCPDAPYGMTYPEVVPTGHNIINNNNIVTRNTEVYDSIGTNKKTPEWVLRMGNQWAGQRKLKLTIDSEVNNFWDLGYYVVHLGTNIHSAWEAGGSSGDGYTLEDNTFYVYDDGFYLEDITLDSGEWGWVHFQFRLYEETEIEEDRGQQMFSFVQYSFDEEASTYNPDGGFNFLLNLQPDTAYTDPHVDSLDFSIVPNPTEYAETVGVVIDMNFYTTTAVLNIYDQWGNSVISPMDLGTLGQGQNTRNVYIAELSAGSYSVVITANGQNYSETMIVVN